MTQRDYSTIQYYQIFLTPIRIRSTVVEAKRILDKKKRCEAMKFNLTREIELDLTFWLVYTLLLVPENNNRREINIKDINILYIL